MHQEVDEQRHDGRARVAAAVALRGWVVGEVDVGHTSECEDIRRVRVVTSADEAQDVGSDVVMPHFVQRCHTFLTPQCPLWSNWVEKGKEAKV